MPRPVFGAWRALLLVFALLLLFGRVAAQAPDPLSEAYEAGMRAFHAHDLETAATHFEKALAIARERYGTNDPRIATDLNNLAEVYRLLGRFDEAERLYREALALDQLHPTGNAAGMATTLNNLALLYRAQERFDAAEELYRQALRLLEEAVGPNHQDVARLLNNWAMLKLARGQPAEALELEKRAIDIAQRALSPDHPSLRVLQANLERIRSALAARHTASPQGQGSAARAAADGRVRSRLA
jgi:tetratricopeptide (TPR) repeat protein